jgi:polar amino acid transport system substrate-binding protein
MRRSVIGIIILLVAVFASVVFAAESTLDKVKKDGILKVGVRYDTPPMGFVNKQGEVDGFEIDLVKEIAKKLGVRIEFVQAISTTRIPLIVNGNVDIVIATMTHTRQREEAIDFSIHYYISSQSFITRKNSGITKVAQLDGKRVGGAQGSTSAKNLLQVLPKANMVYFQELTEALLALKQGKVEAVVGDNPVNLFWLEKNPELVVPDKPYYTEPWGMGLRQNDSRWRAAVNNAVLELWDSKTFHSIFRKWFNREPDYEIPWYP